MIDYKQDPKAGPFVKLAKLCVTNHYRPLPIKPGAKFPTLENWPKLRVTHRNAQGLFKRHLHDGLGLATSGLVGIDIDSSDEKVVAKTLKHIYHTLGVAPTRVGNAPRVMVFYQVGSERAATDARPRKSYKYVDTFGELHRVEFTTGPGQQAVVDAVHPVTSTPYRFIDPQGILDGLRIEDCATVPIEDALLATPRGELPRATTQKCNELSTWFDESMQKHRPLWEIKKGLGHSQTAQPKPSETIGGTCDADFVSSPLETIKEPLDISDRVVVETLEALDAAEADYDEWLNVGMGLHHQYDGDDMAFNLWQEWGSDSPSFVEKTGVKKWRSFSTGSRPGALVTFATALKMSGGDSKEVQQASRDDPKSLMPFNSAPPAAVAKENPKLREVAKVEKEPEGVRYGTAKERDIAVAKFIREIARRYIYCETGSQRGTFIRINEHSHVELCEIPALTALFANKLVPIAVPNDRKDADGSPMPTIYKQTNPVAVLLGSPNRLSARAILPHPQCGRVYRSGHAAMVNNIQRRDTCCSVSSRDPVAPIVPRVSMMELYTRLPRVADRAEEEEEDTSES